MLQLIEDIPARTRIRAEILYKLGYLSQSIVDSSSRAQLISLVDAMHLVVNSTYGISNRKVNNDVQNQQHKS